MRSQRIFVVHGREHRPRDEIASLLRDWGLTPIILSKVPDFGGTIIEKFEHYAGTCEFAIVLLTPEDKNAEELPERERFRARQNVIFEMGWFFAKLRRSRTLLLYKGVVELPSDVTGILYKEFKESPLELAEEIKLALVSGKIRLEPRLPKPIA